MKNSYELIELKKLFILCNSLKKECAEYKVSSYSDDKEEFVKIMLKK